MIKNLIMNSSRIVFLSSSFLLAGCAAGSVFSMKPVVAEPDLVGTRIAQSAEKASQALDSLSAIEQARAPAIPGPQDYSNATPEMLQPITIRWSGPIEQISATLAQYAGLGFQTIGNRPAVPLIVSVDVYQKPLVEVLHDVGLQAGRRADLSVNPSNKVVEIRYAAADRN